MGASAGVELPLDLEVEKLAEAGRSLSVVPQHCVCAGRPALGKTIRERNRRIAFRCLIERPSALYLFVEMQSPGSAIIVSLPQSVKNGKPAKIVSPPVDSLFAIN